MLKQNIPFRNFTVISLELPVMNISGAVKILETQEHILPWFIVVFLSP